MSVAEGEDPPHAGTAGTCVRCRARLCPREEKLEFTCSGKQMHVKKTLCAPTGDGAEWGRRAGAQSGGAGRAVAPPSGEGAPCHPEVRGHQDRRSERSIASFATRVEVTLTDPPGTPGPGELVTHQTPREPAGLWEPQPAAPTSPRPAAPVHDEAEPLGCLS